MKLDVPSPEQAAELAAWWREAFQVLTGQGTPAPPSNRDREAST